MNKLQVACSLCLLLGSASTCRRDLRPADQGADSRHVAVATEAAIPASTPGPAITCLAPIGNPAVSGCIAGAGDPCTREVGDCGMEPVSTCEASLEIPSVRPDARLTAACLLVDELSAERRPLPWRLQRQLDAVRPGVHCPSSRERGSSVCPRSIAKRPFPGRKNFLRQIGHQRGRPPLDACDEEARRNALARAAIRLLSARGPAPETIQPLARAPAQLQPFIPSLGLLVVDELIHRSDDSTCAELHTREFKCVSCELPHSSAEPLCASAPFRAEPHVPCNQKSCTAMFLDGRSFATASHCIDDAPMSLVLGFQLDTTGASIDGAKVIGSEHIRLVAKGEGKNDWALFVLTDQAAAEIGPIQPVRWRDTALVEGELVQALTHPAGLPGKFLPPGKSTRRSAEPFFEAELEAYGGSSGSPVFDAAGLLIGIYRGADDGTPDMCTSPTERCERYPVCPRGDCDARSQIALPTDLRTAYETL